MLRILIIVMVIFLSTHSTLFATSAYAENGCTIVQPLGNATPIFQEGDMCDQTFAPASTFKLVLALIGFETGTLHSPDRPSIEYDSSLNAPYKNWRQAISPRTWLRYSVIWYSHWLTRQLGITELQQYVDTIDYGNRDLSGTFGKDDGLTHAWLSTSLQITPAQQSKFLQRLLLGDLAFSQLTLKQTLATAQSFEAIGGISLKGKTGNAWAIDTIGNRLQEQHGWFVGWFEHQGVKYTFVHLIIEDGSQKGFASSRAKQEVLTNLLRWLQVN